MHRRHPRFPSIDVSTRTIPTGQWNDSFATAQLHPSTQTSSTTLKSRQGKFPPAAAKENHATHDIFTWTLTFKQWIVKQSIIRLFFCLFSRWHVQIIHLCQTKVDSLTLNVYICDALFLKKVQSLDRYTYIHKKPIFFFRPNLRSRSLFFSFLVLLLPLLPRTSFATN